MSRTARSAVVRLQLQRLQKHPHCHRRHSHRSLLIWVCSSLSLERIASSYVTMSFPPLIKLTRCSYATVTLLGWYRKRKTKRIFPPALLINPTSDLAPSLEPYSFIHWASPSPSLFHYPTRPFTRHFHPPSPSRFIPHVTPTVSPFTH